MYYSYLGFSRAEQKQKREEEILSIVKLYWNIYNYSPTVREITEMASVTSTSTVLKYLNKLQEKGILEWQQKKPRTIHIIGINESSAN